VTIIVLLAKSMPSLAYSVCCLVACSDLQKLWCTLTILYDMPFSKEGFRAVRFEDSYCGFAIACAKVATCRCKQTGSAYQKGKQTSNRNVPIYPGIMKANMAKT